MQKKIKLSIIAALAFVIILVGVICLNKIARNKNVPQTNLTSQAILEQAVNENATKGITQEISGKIRSINEKAVYIELSDGKGFAANINSKMPVITQGVTKPGTLVDLKAGQNITVKADSANNAVEILIKK